MEIYDDVNDIWKFLVSILYNFLDTYAPLHTVASKRFRCHTPWMTISLLSVIKRKKKAKRRAESTQAAVDIKQY